MNELELSKSNSTVIAKMLDNEKAMNKMLAFFDNDSSRVQKFKTNLINIAGNSILSQCTPNSIIKSAFTLAEIGLDINQSLKQAYILKYSSDAEAVISYKGWQILLERVGKKSRAFCVFKCDEFNIDYSTFEGSLCFKPNFEKRDETNPKWFYENLIGVLVRIKDVVTDIETYYFVSAKKIDKLKGCSPSVKRGRGSPYDTWFEEMYLAKAIKYVLSKEPMANCDVKLSKALELENELEVKAQEANKKDEEIKTFESLMAEDSDIEEMVVENMAEMPQI